MIKIAVEYWMTLIKIKYDCRIKQNVVKDENGIIILHRSMSFI